MNARFSGEPEARPIDPRVAVLDQLAEAYERHAEAEQLARGIGDIAAEEKHHVAVLLLAGMCKEAER